jgi:hypothetical protein
MIVLWARSYYSNDMIFGPISRARALCLGSTQGRVSFMFGPRVRNEWHSISESIGTGEDLWANVWKDYDKSLGFGRINQGPVSNFVFPHFAIAIIFSVVAAAPWLRRRFTLRTILIAMTVVAAALGVLAYLSTE